MEKAIKKAIEGGYVCNGLRPLDLAFLTTGQKDKKINQLISVVLLDPLFWQALGKAEGWPELKQPYQTGNGEWVEISWPEYKMHEFVHHINKGKDAESFFNELIK